MLSSLRLLGVLAGLVIAVACNGGDSGETGPVAEGAGGEGRPGTAGGPGDGGGRNGYYYRLFACNRGNGPAQWEEVTITGPGPASARTMKLPRGHELIIKANTVPAQQTHVYRFAEIGGSDTGCRVTAELLSPGSPTPATDAYTLRIRCQGHGRPNCPADRVVRRKEEAGTVGWAAKADGAGEDRFVVLRLSHLASTYALAVPGGPPGDDAAALPDTGVTMRLESDAVRP